MVDVEHDRKLVPEDAVWRILAQLVYALAYCHGHTRVQKTVQGGTMVVPAAVLHRDVKPGNVFLTDHTHCIVKLGDFGLAKVVAGEAAFTQTVLGTPYYMAPEQVTGEHYNAKCDVWSLGCLVHELCALHPPFSAPDTKALIANICACRRAPLPHAYSHDLERVVAAMLNVNVCSSPHPHKNILTHSHAHTCTYRQAYGRPWRT